MTDKNNIRTEFGMHLKELCAERGLSQDGFANSIGMARSYYAEVEVGKRNISLENIDRIACGFGIDLAELFSSDIFSSSECAQRMQKPGTSVENINI